MSMSRKKRLALYVGIAVLALFILFKIGKAIFIAIKFSGGPKMPPAPVEVAKVTQTQWQNKIDTTGTITAIQGVMVSSEVSGRITKIYFKSGSFVQKGDPLFQIYPDILNAQLKDNEAALTLAQLNYTRAAALYKKRVISKEQLDQYTANLQQAQAMVDKTKANLVQHNIVAPFSGRIGLKTVDVGDYVNVGEQLVSLQQVNPLRVDFYVPDRYIESLLIGDKVDVMPSSTPSNTVYVGKVYALNSVVDPDTRSFSMWARIPNPDGKLVPGTYVNLSIYTGKPHTVLTIPQTAAMFSPQGDYVFQVVDDKAVKTEVTLGQRQHNWIEVESGLKAGDVIITAGQIKVFNGATVKIAPTTTYEAGKSQSIDYIRLPSAQSSGSQSATSTGTPATANASN